MPPPPNRATRNQQENTSTGNQNVEPRMSALKKQVGTPSHVSHVSPMPPPASRYVSTPIARMSSPRGTPGKSLRHVLSQTPGLHALKRARLNTPNRPSPRTPLRSAAKSWAGQVQMNIDTPKR